MPVIAIINQKGGVGKTCLATNLASALRSHGPGLLLDCDPQPRIHRRTPLDGVRTAEGE